eukprot:409173_1
MSRTLSFETKEIFERITDSEIVEEMNIPVVICNEIAQFAEGQIKICQNCQKEIFIHKNQEIENGIFRYCIKNQNEEILIWCHRCMNHLEWCQICGEQISTEQLFTDEYNDMKCNWIEYCNAPT